MWLTSMLIYLSYIGINTLFMGILAKMISHPKYSLNIAHEDYDIYSTYLLFFGFSILLFRKKIRRKRTREFYEYANKNRMFIKEFGMIAGVEITIEELDNLNRIIKLEELKNKIKNKK